MQRLRRLDVDDMIIMRSLLQGMTVTAISKILFVTQPAVTGRIRKIQSVFDGDVVRRNGRNVSITPLGMAVGHRATEALKILEECLIFMENKQ